MDERAFYLPRSFTGMNRRQERYAANARRLRAIIDAVARASRIERQDLVGESKAYNLMDARFVVVRIALSEGMKPAQIGRAIGGRDHTTILSARDRVIALLDRNDARAEGIRELQDRAEKILAGLVEPDPPPDPERKTEPGRPARPVCRHGTVNAEGEIILHPWSVT